MLIDRLKITIEEVVVLVLSSWSISLSLRVFVSVAI